MPPVTVVFCLPVISGVFVRYTVGMKKIMSTDSVRSFVFGVEDSLVSTIGLVSGIAAVGTGKAVILVTGFILIAVEAFSMAIGTLLSDNSADEYRTHSRVAYSRAYIPSIIMFFSYILAGLLVLFPYILLPHDTAFVLSIALSLVALFALGVVSAFVSGIPTIKKGITMVIIGGIAIVIGISVGLCLDQMLSLYPQFSQI
jgi:VIT1/CCC1 family predicted Fe2+/Mn2+ transporter